MPVFCYVTIIKILKQYMSIYGTLDHLRYTWRMNRTAVEQIKERIPIDDLIGVAGIGR